MSTNRATTTKKTQQNNDLLNLIDSTNLNDTTELKQQQIFSPNKFIEEIAKEHDNIEKICIYFFHERAKQKEQYGGWDNQSTVYLHPVLILAYYTDKSYEALDMNELKEKYGDDFGIQFNTSRKRRINKIHKVNILEIQMQTESFESDRESKEYHPSRTILYSAQRKFLDGIVDKFYKDAPQFKFASTKITNNEEENQLMDILDKLKY